MLADNKNMVKTYEIDFDDELVNEASRIFETLGTDIDTAINIFLKQAVLRKGFPFEVAIPNEENEETEELPSESSEKTTAADVTEETTESKIALNLEETAKTETMEMPDATETQTEEQIAVILPEATTQSENTENETIESQGNDGQNEVENISELKKEPEPDDFHAGITEDEENAVATVTEPEPVSEKPKSKDGNDSDNDDEEEDEETPENLFDAWGNE